MWCLWRSWLARQIVALEAESSNLSRHPTKDRTGAFLHGLFFYNGSSPSGKARDFDSRIPLVRIQLAQPAKRPQRINILWRSFGIGGSYARCAAFLFFHPPRRPGFSKARLGARRLLVSTTGKKFSCRRLYIPANNCYTETSSYTIPRTVMVAMIRS